MSSELKSSATLSPARRELLALMLKKKGVNTELPQTIPRRHNGGPCPLSFAQERIWFFEQLQPGTASYNVPAALRMKGALDVESLQQGLSEILRRHEALHTVFEFVDGKPLQRIVPPSALPLTFFDLRSVALEERERRAASLLESEVRRPFDLTIGPLLRCALVQLEDNEHLAQLTLHHISSDGWSRHILVRELSALYNAFVSGKPSPLPELQIQYADFAVWQREWLQGKNLERLLSYWQKQLEAAPAKLNLATDRPRSAERSFDGALESMQFSDELTLALKELCRRENVTLFMLLLAAFKMLLYRYTWQEDIVVGTPIANRTNAQTEGLIGFFVNTLVLRTDLSGNPTFRELLKRVREKTLEAYAHQDMPFDKLVDMVQAKRELSHDPLFQVFFSLNNNPVWDIKLAGITLAPYFADSGVAKFDLEISLIEWRERLIAKAIFKAALFDTSTIKLMLERYRALLQGIVNDPGERLLNLPIACEEETTTQRTHPTFLNTDEFTFDELAT